MKLAKMITVDREGLLFDGERLPYYVADPGDDPVVIVKDSFGICRVTVTLLANAAEVIEDGLYVDTETRVVGMNTQAAPA